MNVSLECCNFGWEFPSPRLLRSLLSDRLKNNDNILAISPMYAISFMKKRSS